MGWYAHAQHLERQIDSKKERIRFLKSEVTRLKELLVLHGIELTPKIDIRQVFRRTGFRLAHSKQSRRDMLEWGKFKVVTVPLVSEQGVCEEVDLGKFLAKINKKKNRRMFFAGSWLLKFLWDNKNFIPEGWHNRDGIIRDYLFLGNEYIVINAHDRIVQDTDCTLKNGDWGVFSLDSNASTFRIGFHQWVRNREIVFHDFQRAVLIELT